MTRDYKREYKAYHATPEQVMRRASRNKARSLIKAKTSAAAIKGKEVDHKNMNPLDNRPKNLSLVSRAVNRRKQPKRNNLS